MAASLTSAYIGASYAFYLPDWQVPQYPFTVGCWASTEASAGTIVSFPDISASNVWFRLGVDATPAFYIGARAGGAGEQTAAAGTINTGSPAWHYVLGRFISSTNRRISCLHPDGSTSHAQSTTNRSTSGVNGIYVGGLYGSTGYTDLMTGAVGELWWASGDIQPDGGQTNDDMLRTLAYRGPLVSRVLGELALRQYLGFSDGVIVRPHIGMRDTLASRTGLQILNYGTTGTPRTYCHPPLAPMARVPRMMMARGVVPI